MRPASSDHVSASAHHCRTLPSGEQTCHFNMTTHSPHQHDANNHVTAASKIHFSLKDGACNFSCSKYRPQGAKNHKNKTNKNDHRSNRTTFAPSSSWTGNCKGNDARISNSTLEVNLISRPHQETGLSQLFGSINLGQEICRIAPSAVGVTNTSSNATASGADTSYNIICQNVSSFPPEAMPHVDENFYLRRRANAMRNASSGQAQRELTTETDPDIMVIWTTNAECRASGLPRGCTLTSQTETNMRGLIDLAVSETNVAYDASGVDMQLRLVFAFRDPNYQEASTSAYTTALTQITNPSDGVLDYVHNLRSQYGADLVSMLIDDNTYCGIAWVGPALNYMFSVVNWMCATGYYSFGHETGHNMVRIT